MNIINGKVSDDDDITGDVGVIISGNTGVVHLGDGDIIVNSTTVTTTYAGSKVTGPGVTIVNGDNIGGIRKSFGGRRGKK